MADQLVSRMRNLTGFSNPFMALHLRFEKGMVGSSFCDFVGTRMEKALMAMYRLKELPLRFKLMLVLKEFNLATPRGREFLFMQAKYMPLF